ncbi:DUF4435 domain-containing protein [Flavobacterium psychrophilum]
MLDFKRKLDELIAIYTLEEELLDIYVEGPTDRFIFENFCEYKELDKSIIEIDTIDLSETQELFPDLNLKSNKDKLIALSRILEQNKIKSKITCIIDRDFDGILFPLEENDFLTYTDFSCAESYIFCKKHIEKLTKVGLKNFPHKTDIIISEVSKVLLGLFILRMINKKFDLNFKFPKIENNMPTNKVTGICDFNFQQYLDIYINTNKLINQKTEILDFVKLITTQLNSDYRFNMNGHDFIEVLFNYVNKIKNTPNFKLDNFENALMLSVQPNYLEDYELFKLIGKA